MSASKTFRVGALAAAALLLSVTTLVDRSAPAVAAVAVSASRIALDAQPTWVAVDPSRSRAYVTATGAGTLEVIDLATASVEAAITLGGAPAVVGVDPGLARAYVSDFGSGGLSIVDLAARAVVARTAGGGLGIAVDAVKHRVFAAGGRHIDVLDGAKDGTVLSTIVAPEGANLWGVAFDAASGRVFATDIFAPRLLAFDPESGELAGEVRLPAPGRFAIDAMGGRIFVATYAAPAELVVIDAASLAVVGRTTVGDFPFALALHPGRGEALVGSLTGGVVAVAGTSHVALRSRLAVGGTPHGVAIVGDRMLVVDRSGEITGTRGCLLLVDLTAGSS